MPLIADHDSFYRTANYPLVSECDMEVDLKEEATDLCVAAAEKYKDNIEKATQVRNRRNARCADSHTPWLDTRLNLGLHVQVAKEALDKKFGGRWHIVMGDDFAYEVTHEVID